MQTQSTPAAESELATNDLGPLAWVLDELRKSLDGASKAMRRFVRDAELARGNELAELDASQLRIARQQLHQAVGALEMVGLGAPAKLLRAMEALAQKFVARPELCSDDAANKVERASFALTEYLEGVLKGRQISSVALFPQYRDVMDMVGSDRVHPADLWAHEWRWIDAALPGGVPPLQYEPSVRARVDQAVLNVVRTGDPIAADRMCQVSRGLAAAAAELEPRVFWKVCAGFFEAIRCGLCPADVYVKRTASRIIAQYAALARGESEVVDRLAQDLLFYCAHAVPARDSDAPVLAAVRSAYGLSHTAAIDYATPQFGRFDPAVLVQARKRLAAATETWAALAGGDSSRIKQAYEQFSAVAESMQKLHPESDELARALMRAIDTTSRTGDVPQAGVAMEVATAVLYLEAAYDDLDPTDTQMAQRSARLAQRLDHVIAGAAPEPMEPWMEELYRRVSDRQTMGSVVDELRNTLAQVEKSLDQFFRNPGQRAPLAEVPGQLAQMRGVFSVLGLDQASTAARRMRDSVEQFLVDEVQDGASGVFEKLGNSLGAMGFLVDMLGYQRALAKQLFVYDEALGEFRPVMGREKASATDAAPVVTAADAVAQPAVAAHTATIAPVLTSAVAPASEEDTEMREIFLEEAREVVQTGLQAVLALDAAPGDLGEQTTLRRAFHTLKGSSRMVGLNEFGEAAWAMEQLVNTWLAEQKPASQDLRGVCGDAMGQFKQWVEDIATGSAARWSAAPFRTCADALRVNDVRIALRAPDVVEPEPVVSPESVAAATPDIADAVAQGEAIAMADAVASEPLPATEPETESESEWEAGLAETGFVDSTGYVQPLRPEAQPSVHSEALQSGFADFDLSLPDDEPADAAAAKQSFAATEMFASSQLPIDPAAVEHRVRVPGEDFDATQMFESSELFSASELPSDAADATQEAAQQSVTEPAALEQQTADVDADSTRIEAELAPARTAAAQADAVDTAKKKIGSDASSIDSLDFDFGDAGRRETFKELSQNDVETQRGALLPEDGSHAPASDSGGLTEEGEDEQLKVIGALRISIPLYNVYLNEADEWSRRLSTELSEWALELDQPLHDSTVGLAHALAGSSATVGFVVVADLARLLEQALLHVQLHGVGLAEHAQVFNRVADDIRRLLHQFAAGFLKDADPTLAVALRDILRADLVAGAIAGRGANAATGGVAAGAAPLIVASDEHSDAVDALDADLFPIFEEEATELLPKLGAAMRQWLARPDDRAGRNEALRVLHTLKGSA
ncbi:MAG: Hpt domain-containing protein, partial [Burkholderiaceae bacterium]